MPVTITSGAISPGVQYVVSGAQSVTYNGTAYATGQSFRGISGIKTFTYSGSGTQLLYEVQEARGQSLEFAEERTGYAFPEALKIRGTAVEYAQNGEEAVVQNTSKFQGFAIEFAQSGKDIVVPDTTALKGFGLELLDHPLYAFEVTESR